MISETDSNTKDLFYDVDELSYGIDPNDNTIYRTRSGVVLKLKPVSSMLINKRSDMVPVPVPPKITLDNGRTEDNYADRDYVKAVNEYDRKIADINVGTVLLMGTEVVSRPDSVPDVNDRAWSDQLSNPDTWGEFATQVPESGDARYIFWMAYIVLRDIEAAEVGSQIRVLGGAVNEDMVKVAMSTFRGDAQRPTNPGVDTKPNRAQRRSSNTTKRQPSK